MLRAIIFDLDETLIDREQTMRGFLEAQHRRLLYSGSASEFAARVLSFQDGGYADKRAAYALALDGHDRDTGHLTSVTDALMSDFLENYGMDAVCFPDADVTLAELKQQFSLGLVSNGRARGQRAKLSSAGIGPYFDVVVISEEAGVSKPDPAIFIQCLSGLGIQPQESLYVGDHPVNDIEPAVTLGMYAVWLRNARFSEAPLAHGVIDHIRELPGLIRSGLF
ncbi:MAG: HAD family hydrolase [Proteobacteria bacterium]|jgi:putative hydrolase of the HAD superfamily|nr:HAD family hydrolase [Pseudomonadota bacterium]MDA1300372.1 HAD family hydrolase [Pseudomonadota bacterium]